MWNGNSFRWNLICEVENGRRRFNDEEKERLLCASIRLSCGVKLVCLNIKQIEPSCSSYHFQMNGFNLRSNLDAFLPDFVWTINGIEELIGKKKFETYSEELFGWSEYLSVGAQVKLSMDTYGAISASLNLIPIGPITANLKLIPTVYYVLRDRSGRKEAKQHLIRSFSYEFLSKFNFSLQFEKELCHKAWLASSSRYNVNDSVVLEVYVEPPPSSASAQAAHSHNGILNWKMENLYWRKRAEVSRSLDYQESPYFYTGVNGYRVQAWIGLNGYGPSLAHVGKEIQEGLMVELTFLTGEFDADLPAIFPHRTRVSLRSPSFPKHRLTRTFYENLEAQRGYDIFIPLDDEKLMADDSLFINVVIEPIVLNER